MGFNVDRFKMVQFADRCVEVRVPDLAAWFEPGSAPVWKVRGLNGDELGRINEAVERHRAMGAIADGLVSPDQRERADAIRQILGISDKTRPGWFGVWNYWWRGAWILHATSIWRSG